MAEVHETEVVEDGELIVSAGELIAAQTGAEIDKQIATAKRYPRVISKCRKECQDLSCLDEETAASCFYVLKRGSKTIQGPSARFAEIVGYAWGNLRFGARVSAVDDKFITAQGFCFDLEKNNSATFEIRRRITYSDGTRYNDDMIVVTGNAACSIAMRNAIFKVIPMSIVKPVYDATIATARGEAKPLALVRDECLGYFLKLGATESQVLQAIERASIDDVTRDDIVILRGIATSIKDGESTLEEALGPVPDLRKKVKRSELNETLAKPQTDKSGPVVEEPRPTPPPKSSTKSDSGAAHDTSSDVVSHDGYMVGYGPDSPPFSKWPELQQELKSCKNILELEESEGYWRQQMVTTGDNDRLRGLVKMALERFSGKKAK